MKKALFIILSIFIFLIICFQISNTAQQQKVDQKIGKIRINKSEFTIEIADTEDKHTKGLSGRKFLAKDSGMLFVFPVYGTYSFWMKGMQFPLDFVWIKDDIVVDLTGNVPFPKDPVNGPFDFYSSLESVNKVLEINAGEIKRQGIKKGDKIVYN